MTPQSAFMICASIRAGQLANLRKLLAKMNNNKITGFADPHNKLIPFGSFERLHFARFSILEALTSEEIRAYGKTPEPWQPMLVFLGDVDGNRDSFLAELVTHAEKGLHQIFSFCDGYPDVNSESLLAWLKAHHVKPAANYVNTLGRTVRQVHEEAALHRILTSHLQQIVETVGRDNTRELRQRLLDHVEIEKFAGRLRLTPPASTPWCWRICNLLNLIAVPLLLLLLLPFIVLFAPVFIIWLFFTERSDPELFIRPDPEHVKKLSAQEDWLVSNQFNVFGDIKPGLVRLWLFKFIMLLTDYAARHIYNHGFLTRIRTIHFARWVFLDDNRRAFFASNYDGSHESYMDDFINKVGWGLNLTFGGAVGYPRTRWLLFEGALREQQFKYTQRRHQLGSEVWYKAYPDLTAVDLQHNSLIRQGVEVRQDSDEQIRAWLSLI
ncbi:MAG: hypothetical protein ABL925_04045 [Methylococcales bacterium]